MSSLDPSSIDTLESCNSTWMFDRQNMQFRRLLKGLDLDTMSASTNWRPYFGLEVDDESGAFVIKLNEPGTRLLRAWRHQDPCPQCGTSKTTEISLSDLKEAMDS
ncbi:MAG: hypothetical protein HKL80_02795 [Acidimicrobiales bacterium]|nr:hypothetical protein [Acidimicrobiales bacterium]